MNIAQPTPQATDDGKTIEGLPLTAQEQQVERPMPGQSLPKR